MAGAENVTVLVSDDTNRTLLPSVVERMLGLPQGLLNPGDEVVNRSLTYGEVELLRAVNAHFEERGYPASATTVWRAPRADARPGRPAPAPGRPVHPTAAVLGVGSPRRAQP